MQRKNCASSRRWYASVSSPSSASASANSRCVYASGGGVAFTCAESAVSSVMRLVGAKGKEKKESVFASVTASSKNSVRRNRMLLLTAHAGAHRDRSRFAVKPMPRLLTGSTMFWIWLLPDTVTPLSSSSPS